MIKMKLLIASFFNLLFCASLFAQRDTIELNDQWQFKPDLFAKGMVERWYEQLIDSTCNVQLPHTWNIDERTQQHYGWGWYQKKIMIPAEWENKNVVIQFGAINHSGIIYVNGNKISENIGDGFNKFRVNLNGKLKYGKENIITVACNNDYGQVKVPFGNSFDWPNDGGLIRKVALIVSEKTSADYFLAEPQFKTLTNEGVIKIRLGVPESKSNNIQLHVVITEENQPTSKSIYSNTIKPNWENGEANATIRLSKINPWHFDFPNLYRIEVSIISGKKTTDKVSTNIGFREIKFLNGKMYLNGESVKLMGVEWTAGSNPNYGFAETDSVILSQCKLMKEVNCIFSRQHFQQADLFYDFCDRNGILVQQELPLWGPETPANDTILTIAMRQLELMIHNLYNHPSIFSWGVGNELRARDASLKKMIARLFKYSRELDSFRNAAYVSNTLKDGFYNNPKFVPDASADGDYLMMNEYGGSWWPISQGGISNYLDSIHLSYPEKPFFISEFGLCEPNFKGGDERRVEDLIYHMAVYESKPYINGAIYFDLTDYRTHYPGTFENNKYRRRIHGVYDMYGNPKPSMKVLREHSSPIEIHGITKGSGGKLFVKVIGSIGLPQHSVKGYKLYVSGNSERYQVGNAYPIPDIQPGESILVELRGEDYGKHFITIIRPTGFIATQKKVID